MPLVAPSFVFFSSPYSCRRAYELFLSWLLSNRTTPLLAGNLVGVVEHMSAALIW